MSISSKKCLKCGRSPSTHPGTKLFHYPKPGTRNYLRCEIWAKYCFPGDESSSQEFQQKLFEERRVLCDKHFKRTSFIDHPDGTTKLIAYAVPLPDDEVLQSVDKKDFDPYHVTIKQEKDETDFYPHLVTIIKKEPDSSNYVNDENVDIKLENVKCEIKEEAFAGSTSNELPPETLIDTGIKEDYVQENTTIRCGEEIASGLSSDAAEDEPGRGSVLSQNLTSCEEFLRNSKVLKSEVEKFKARHTEKSFSCSICNRHFTAKRRLLAHSRVHIGDKPFICDICDRKFSHKCSLLRHLIKHGGAKSFTCDICPRKFYYDSELQTHLRIHTGEKPFSCDICECKFSQRSALKMHLRTHTGEKPFSCDHCERKFSVRSNFKSHLSTHTGEKPFSCDICYRKFSEKSALKKHLKIYIGENPIDCNICDRKFHKKSRLQSHLKIHTDEIHIKI